MNKRIVDCGDYAVTRANLQAWNPPLDEKVRSKPKASLWVRLKKFLRMKGGT